MELVHGTACKESGLPLIILADNYVLLRHLGSAHE